MLNLPRVVKNYKKLISRRKYPNVTWLYRLITETNHNPKHSYSESLVPAWSEHHHHKKELHWLPVTYRIQYKAALLTYMVHDNRCSQYLRGSVVSAGSEPGRHDLRSTTNLNYILPRTWTKFVDRAFSLSGCIVWNNLPLPVRLSPTLDWLQTQPEVTFLTVLLTNFNVLFVWS